MLKKRVDFSKDLSGRAWRRELSALNVLCAYLGGLIVQPSAVAEAYDELADFIETVADRMGVDFPEYKTQIGDYLERDGNEEEQ